MDANAIVAEAELWAKAYLGFVTNVPRRDSLILGYAMGKGLDQVATQAVINHLTKRECTGYSKRG